MGQLAEIAVLPALGKASWSGAQLLQYEVALEAVRQAIGHYAQRIAEAEAAGESACDEIAMLRAEQAAWAARAQDLDPLDTGAVKQLRTDADDLLSEDEDGAGE
ncbi:hypothetical protein [Kribbella sp. NPDC048915]|uniref:hypothetical protein n=1 Tax=Kribbella sp. NPDC048915 TaxID=3155148 RepID=UPI0033EAD980